MANVPAKPKVVSLYGLEMPPAGEALPEVVAEAERILEMALAGEVHGIAVVLTHADEFTTSNKVGMMNKRSLGQMCLLSADMADKIRGKS